MLKKSVAELATCIALLRNGFINWMGGVFIELYEGYLWHFAYVLQMRLRHLIQAINRQNCNPLFHSCPFSSARGWRPHWPFVSDNFVLFMPRPVCPALCWPPASLISDQCITVGGRQDTKGAHSQSAPWRNLFIYFKTKFNHSADVMGNLFKIASPPAIPWQLALMWQTWHVQQKILGFPNCTHTKTARHAANIMI